MPITDYFDPQLSLCVRAIKYTNSVSYIPKAEDMENLQGWGMNVVRFVFLLLFQC